MDATHTVFPSAASPRRHPHWLVGVAAFALATAAHAQTTVNFTGTSATTAVVNASTGTAIGDNFDGSSNLDGSKQNSLGGSNQPLDIVGTSTAPAIQVTQGYSGTSTNTAIQFQVRLANYSPTTDGLMSAAGVAVLIDTDQNGAANLGVGVSFKSGASGTFQGVYLITPKTGTTTDASLQFTTTLLQSSTSYVSYTAAGSSLGIQSGTGDGLLTFVVLNSDIRAQTGTNLTLTSTTGITAFTNSGGTGLGSGNINADFITTTGTATAPLQFGVVAATRPVPEFPTALLVAALIGPPALWRVWRSRLERAAAVAA